MIDRNKIRARSLAKRILPALPSMGEARELFRAAMAGEGSPADAVYEAPPDMRGAVVVALFLAGIADLQAAFTEAWFSNHIGVKRTAAAEGNCLNALILAANLPPPADMPSSVTCWRGTIGVNLATARVGRSWTTKREAACHLIMTAWPRAGFRTGNPLLIRRDIRKEDILMYWPGGDTAWHDEIVVSTGKDGDVDGTPEEWRETGMGWWLSEHLDRL